MSINFSVLIPIYHRENPTYFRLALKSIWQDQTLKPTEIIIVKDGPLTKELDAILVDYLRIAPTRVITLSRNMGLGYALALGVNECSYEFVARMDSDDIAVPSRFQEQINILISNPEIDLLSSNIAEFKDNPAIIGGIRKVPTQQKDILRFAKKRNPMNHMAVMFKKSAVQNVGNYQPFHGYEDYFLWVRMLSKGYKAANLNENLVYARTGNNMIARRQGIKYFTEEFKFQKKLYEIKFTSIFEFLTNVFLRVLPRLFPIVILKIIYFFLRTK